MAKKTPSEPGRRLAMCKEAERIHESAKHSAQNQLEYSKTWRSVDRWLGGLAAILAAIAGAGGLSEVFSAKWSGLIALAAAGVGAVATTLGAPKTKTLAHTAGNAYLALQQDCRNFIAIDVDYISIDEARDTLAKLVSRLQELNSLAELPSRRARKKGKKNIDKGEQTYEVDE
ncbi:MAG TPA: SLATT domain-containing protein [Candidatus Dormibacteraeota bacterium]|nr:SLATT domain-containing protein [Candidatus Dormibacteraeota bacterium]